MKRKKPHRKKSHHRENVGKHPNKLSTEDDWLDTSDTALDRVRFELLTLPHSEATRLRRHNLLTNLGSIYWARREYEAAITIWKQLIQIAEEKGDPTELAKIRAVLATTYGHSGDTKSAIACAQQGLAQDPHNFEALFALGVAYDYAGDEENALLWWRRLLAQYPTSNDTYEHIACVLHRQGKYEEAELHLQRALELDPTSIVALNELGNMYVGLKRYTAAIQQFKRVIRAHPRNPIAYGNLGDCYFHMGNLDKARQNYQQRMQLRPEDALNANLGLGILYRCFPGEKAKRRSVEYFEQALVIYESKSARLLGSRAIEHEGRGALAMSGLGKSEAISAWQNLFQHPEFALVGAGPRKNWLFFAQALAESKHPPVEIDVVVGLLQQNQRPHSIS